MDPATERRDSSELNDERQQDSSDDNENQSEKDQEAEEETTDHDKKLGEKKKSKKKKHYDQKYQAVWEKMPEFRNWITKSTQGVQFFYCNYCKKDYKSGKTEVKRHYKSKKHSDNAAGYGQKQMALLDAGFNLKVNIEQKSKRNAIKIANFIAEHNLSFNISGDLTKMIQSLYLDQEVVQKMSCSRTKCRSIIVNVSGRFSFECLIDKLRENKFSIIIDESTDISSVKCLAIVIRMFVENKVQDEFLCTKEIAKADTDHIYDLLVNYFNENCIPYKDNCIGFAADGASVKMGKNHSVSVKLKADIPFLFILKCICHSFALVASNACKKIPSNVELLVRQIYSYLHCSFKRLTEFAEFQIFFELKPHKMLHPCQTRWLSLLPAVMRVREQYPALKLYFDGEKLNPKNDEKINAGSIHELLSNPINKLYLDFLSYVLPYFTDLNKEFQSETTKIHVLYWKISQVYKTILDCYIKSDILNTQGLD